MSSEPADEPVDPRTIARPEQHPSGGTQDALSPSEVATGKREHVQFICDCNRVACMFCDGGLFACTVCGGFEGSLTSECCGRRLTDDEERKIYNEAVLDFKGGQWINEPNYPRSRHLNQ